MPGGKKKNRTDSGKTESSSAEELPGPDDGEEAEDENAAAAQETPNSGSAKKKKTQKKISSEKRFSYTDSVLRSASLPSFNQKNHPPPRAMILPYIPLKLEQGVLERDMDPRFLGNPLLQNPKSLGSWRPNPFKGKRYGAGSRPKEPTYEESIKIDPGKELTKKPPLPLKDDPSVCGSTMMEKMLASPKNVFDDTQNKYGAQVNTKTTSFECFDMSDDHQDDEELAIALTRGPLGSVRDSAAAFLRDQNRHLTAGLGPVYKKVLADIAAERAVQAPHAGRDGAEDDDEEENPPPRPPPEQLSSSDAALSHASTEAVWYAKSNGRLTRFLGESYYADRLAGVPGSERSPPRGQWAPRHRALLGPNRMIRGFRGKTGREDTAEGDSLMPPKVLWRGLINKGEVEARRASTQNAPMSSTAPPFGMGFEGYGAPPGSSAALASVAPSVPKITLWRETEESWLSHSLGEIPKPERPKTGEQEPAPPPKRSDPKAPPVSVVNESAVPGTAEAWARDAVKMKSYREMAKAMREGKYVGRAQKNSFATAHATATSEKPELGGAAKDAKRSAERHARFMDENPFADDGPAEVVEWEGIEKSWLRQRLAVTH